MNISGLIELLAQQKNIHASITLAKKVEAPVDTTQNAEEVLTGLKDLLSRNDHKQAVSTFLALLLWNAEKVIAQARRNGLFRASRYQFNTGCIKQVIKASLGILPYLEVSDDRERYIRSVQALLISAPHAKKIRKQILYKLSLRKGSALKTLLALLNEVFVEAFANGRERNPLTSQENIQFWSAEDLASAFSYLVNLSREEWGNSPALWFHVDEQVNNSFCNTYESILIGACRINQLLEAEALIDGLPFEVAKNGSTLNIFSTDELFEKTIRLGYIQHEMQQRIRVVRTLDRYGSEYLHTMEQFIENAFKAGLDEYVQLVTHPIERLVFAIPLKKKLMPILEHDYSLFEEIVTLISIEIDTFKSDDAVSLPVDTNLTVTDVIKTQRFFKLIGAALKQKLSEIKDVKVKRKLLFRSIIPIMDQEQLIKMFEFILPKEKAVKILEHLTLTEDQTFVDVQYRPLIQCGSYFIMSPALIAHSNLVRSISNESKRLKDSKKRNKRKSETKNIDLMQTEVVQTLQNAGFEVRSEFIFNIEGKRETDILCWHDNNLFIFECKHSYHPCSPHELRTSYGHLKTARKQLDIRLKWIRNLKNQKKLLDNLKLNVPPTQNIYTGIVTGNRMFSGYSMGSHPVRQAHELINVIARGEIRTNHPTPISFWKGKCFHSTDLIKYLEGNSIVKTQLDKLIPSKRNIDIGPTTLSFHSYTMDLSENS